MVITIDGPSGSGKSTVAELLAGKLGFVHFNSGNLYRATTAFMLEKKVDIPNMENMSIDFELKLTTRYIKGVQHVYVNGKDYTPFLRLNEVSVNSPYVSKNAEIRKIIDNCQRSFAKKHNLVIDGRDTGSFVFPNAEYKFYLDCSVEERAKRRFAELNNSKVSYKQILKELKERDIIDKTKKIAPLIVPENAIIVDSTNLTIDEVVDKLYGYINQ